MGHAAFTIDVSVSAITRLTNMLSFRGNTQLPMTVLVCNFEKKLGSELGGSIEEIAGGAIRVCFRCFVLRVEIVIDRLYNWPISAQPNTPNVGCGGCGGCEGVWGGRRDGPIAQVPPPEQPEHRR
jgi:hypothetical protein